MSNDNEWLIEKLQQQVDDLILDLNDAKMEIRQLQYELQAAENHIALLEQNSSRNYDYD